MPNAAELRAAFAPLAQMVGEIDLSDPDGAKAMLDHTFPISALGELEALAKAAQSEGWLTPKKATETLTFGRLAKPAPDLGENSIDVVHMSGEGAAHTHPNGEVSICFNTAGDDPHFCGHPTGWVVLPPGSHHTPTVTGGTMLIFYFLPQGAMKWGAA